MIHRSVRGGAGRAGVVAGLALGLSVGSVGWSASGAEPDPMSGPRVEERPGAGSGPGAGGRPGGERGGMGRVLEPRPASGDEVPHAMFIRAVRSMIGPEVDESIRLSESQAEAIGEAVRAHADAIRQHRLDRVPEYQRLRQAMRPPRDGRVWTDEEREAAEAARVRLAELMAETPSAEAVQERVRAVLSEAQRSVLDAALRAQVRQLEMIRRGAEGEGRGVGRPGTRDPRAGGVLPISDEEVVKLDLTDAQKALLLGLEPSERAPKLAEIMVGEALAARSRLMRQLRAIDGPVSDEQLAEMRLPEGILERVRPLEPAQRERALGRVLREMEAGERGAGGRAVEGRRGAGGGRERDGGVSEERPGRRDRRPD